MGYDAPMNLHSETVYEFREELASTIPLTIARIMSVSIERAKRWHKGDISEWSPLEWAGAMCGESGEASGAALTLLTALGQMNQHAGEAANAAKKVKRLTDGIASINEADRHYTDVKDAALKVGKEVADTLLYAVLVMASVGITPEESERIIRETFNRKSEEYGFPERI